MYGKELKLNKDKIIKLNKEFHGIVDDNEPEYIEDDFDGMIINPKYNCENELKNAQEKLKQYEEEYNKTQHEYYIDEIEELKQLIENIKTYESPQSKSVYNIDNAFTPAFIDYFCRKYGFWIRFAWPVRWTNTQVRERFQSSTPQSVAAKRAANPAPWPAAAASTPASAPATPAARPS